MQISIDLYISSVLGYAFKDGVMEKREQYLKRISGLQMLYSAILITKPKWAHQHLEHPHGLENGWIWLSNFLMLDPLPEISPTLLLEFIQICAADLWQVYKKQFMKLVMVLHDRYIPKLDKVRQFPVRFFKSFHETVLFISMLKYLKSFSRSIVAVRMNDSR